MSSPRHARAASLPAPSHSAGLEAKAAKGVGHPLDGELVGRDIHDRDAGDLAQPATQIAVLRRDDVALVRCNALHNAVVGIGSAVVARQARLLELLADLSRDPKRESVFCPQLF
eukprot:Amastigsp_a174445_2086.p3 type:complete len:114 gc:universal Amastigsp_a174445_2086:146-487(+)